MYEEIITIDNHLFRLEYDQILGLEQRNETERQIRQIFGLPNIPTIMGLNPHPDMVSIIIPSHYTEKSERIKTTVEGIKQTIGLPKAKYNITMVGSLPKDFNYCTNSVCLVSDAKWNWISSDQMLGYDKNLGAAISMKGFLPKVLVFLDAHIHFFNLESNNWGKIIYDYFQDTTHKDHIVAPAVSLYESPNTQKGYGVIGDDKKYWWGSPPSNNNNQPFEVAGLCGCIMAMRPETFNDSLFGYTAPLSIDDREFSLRMWCLGKDFYAIPSIVVGHGFKSGYEDFNKTRQTQWAYGMLLYKYLNFPDEEFENFYNNLGARKEDKEEARKMTLTDYWKSMKKILNVRKVRTVAQYFEKFAK